MSDAHHDNHGQTPAAWTAVIIIMVASVVATLAVMLGNWPLFWVGIGLVVVGAVVGKVMAMAGLGKQPKADAEGPHREAPAAAGE